MTKMWKQCANLPRDIPKTSLLLVQKYKVGTTNVGSLKSMYRVERLINYRENDGINRFDNSSCICPFKLPLYDYCTQLSRLILPDITIFAVRRKERNIYTSLCARNDISFVRLRLNILWLYYTHASERMKRWCNTHIIHNVLISRRRRNKQNSYASLCNIWIRILIAPVSQWLVND